MGRWLPICFGQSQLFLQLHHHSHRIRIRLEIPSHSLHGGWPPNKINWLVVQPPKKKHQPKYPMWLKTKINKDDDNMWNN